MKDKYFPDRLICESPNGAYQNSPVKSFIIHPPGHNCKPIRKDLPCVEVIMLNGGKRYFGVKQAYIDSHLKVRFTPISEHDEVINTWPDAKD